MNSVEQKNLSEIYKNYAIILSLLIGGGWTVIQFNASLSAETALANLEMARLELIRRPVVEVLLNVESKKLIKNDGGYLFDISVSLTKEPTNKSPYLR